MSDKLYELEVSIKGNVSKLTQSAREAIQSTKRMVGSINSEVDKIKSPAENLNNDRTMQQIRRTNQLIKKSFSDLVPTGTIDKIRNYTKEAQLAAGIKVYTEDYQNLERDIAGTEKELSKLEEKLRNMDESKRFVPTQEFKDLEKNIQNNQSALDRMLEKKRKMEESGKATTPTEEEGAITGHIADAEKRLSSLIAKQKEWQGLGVGNSSVAMKNLVDDIKETEKEIQYLKSELKDLKDSGGAEKPTQEFKELINEISRTEKKLAEYQEQRSQMLLDGSNLEETEAFRQIEMAIADARRELFDYNAEKRSMIASGKDVQFSGGLASRSIGATAGAVKDYGMSQAAEKIRQVNAAVTEEVSKIPIVGRVASEAAFIGSKAFGGLKAVLGKVTSGIKNSGGAFSSLIQRFKTGIPHLNKAKSSMNRLGNTGHGLGGILKTVAISAKFMFASFLIRGAIDSAKQGMQNLAQYSAETNNSLSMLKSSLTQVQNSLATAFAPVLNAVAPVLNTLIDLLVTATTAIGHFFAALTGQKTYTVAKKVQQDYAASLGGTADAANGANAAAKELQRTIMGFDEINKLDDDSGSGGSGGSGSGGSGVGDMFETVEVESAYKDLADKVKSYFQDIFKPMQDAWNTYGEGIINSWKTALGNVLSLLEDIAVTFRDVWTNGTGETICGNILQILKQIGDMLSSIAISFKNAWDDGNRGYNYIQSILNRFNSTLEVIKTIGDSLLTVWNSGSGEEAIGNILGIFTNINNTIANIRTNFANAWKLDSTGTKIIQDLADILNNIGEHVNNITAGLEKWAKGLDLSPLLKAFNNLTTALKPLGDKVGSGLEWLFTNVLQPLAKWAIEQAIPTALKAISGALDAINAVIDLVKPAFTWLWNNFLEPIAKWTGGAITTVLDGIGKGLSGLADLIDGFDTTEVVEVGVSLVKKGWKTVSGWLGDAKNTVLEIGAKIKDKASDLWSGLNSSWNKLTNKTVSFFAKLRDDSSSWWSNTKSWWNSKVGSVSGFSTSVKNNASSWWSNVRSWWNSKVGLVSGFGTYVKNNAETWWKNTKSWWDKKVGLVSGFSTYVKNNVKDWWSNVRSWWSSKVGYVSGFSTYVKNNARDWWDNVKSWWSSKVGYVQSFKTSVSNQVATWWNDVCTWWNDYTKNKSLSATAEITIVKANGMGGSGRTFAEGGVLIGSTWRPVTAAASGGSFSMGQMFIAREAGPELVGTIGGNTAVMNNNQIVSSVSAGVYQAVVAAMNHMSRGSNQQVNVRVILEGDAKGIFRVVKQENDRIVLSTGEPALLT